MIYRIKLIAVIILTGWAGTAFSDFRAEGDLYVQAGNIFMEKSSKISSGPARNNLFQRARVCYERAIQLYYLHLEKVPADASRLMPLITELNSRRFWCNKSTTLVYNHASTPTPEQALKESGLDASMIEEARGGSVEGPKLEDLLGEPEPLSPEEAKKLADQKKTAEFVKRIESYIKSRRIVEARFLCRRAIRKPSMGVPRDLAEQVLREIGYVEQFLASVFDKADTLVGTRLRNEMLVTGRASISGLIKNIENGKLHIDVMSKSSDSDAGLSIGVPLLNFNNLFLIRNTAKRTKPILTGIGSFYLLQGDSDHAGKVFDSIASMKGDPADLNPFISRLKNIAALTAPEKKDQLSEKAAYLISKETVSAIKSYKRQKYDAALSSIGRILEASNFDIKYLLPVSKKTKEHTGKYLPEFVQALVEECHVCKGTRLMTCPNCKGRGRVRAGMGKYRWCPLCKGEGKAECIFCRKRLHNKTYQGYIEKLRSLFKRDEELDTDPSKDTQGERDAQDSKQDAYKKPGSVAAGRFAFKREDGDLILKGMVHNGTAHKVKNAAVTVILLGADNKPVLSGKAVISTVLDPDAEKPFAIRFKNPPEFKSYSYSLAYGKAE